MWITLLGDRAPLVVAAGRTLSRSREGTGDRRDTRKKSPAALYLLRPWTVDDERAIHEFLSVNGGPFCDDCLGGRVGLASDDVKIAILTRAGDFSRAYSRCTACHQPRVVTRKRLVA